MKRQIVHTFIVTSIMYFVGCVISCSNEGLDGIQSLKHPAVKLDFGNSIELELTLSFPEKDLEKKDVYLWRPWHIDDDPPGNIYVSDQKWHAVFKFSPKGSFIGKIGRKGEGPGDFTDPTDLIATNNNLSLSQSDGKH